MIAVYSTVDVPYISQKKRSMPAKVKLVELTILSLLLVQRDIQVGDESGIKLKEKSILALGSLLAKRKQSQGCMIIKRGNEKVHSISPIRINL